MCLYIYYMYVYVCMYVCMYVCRWFRNGKAINKFKLSEHSNARNVPVSSAHKIGMSTVGAAGAGEKMKPSTLYDIPDRLGTGGCTVS